MLPDFLPVVYGRVYPRTLKVLRSSILFPLVVEPIEIFKIQNLFTISM